jgi:endonuclease YncB( thermonuclease family)
MNQTLVHLMVLLVALMIGCQSQEHASVPVSIQAEPPYEYSGRVGRIWGGDNFEVVDGQKIHYAFMRGIDCPEPGQPFYEESKLKLRELCRHRKATIEVLDRDQWKREVCDLTVKDRSTGETIEPAVELLKSGLAWFDQSEGQWAEPYRLAEKVAKEEGKGIWSQSNPTPPWEYWEQQLEQVKEK